jgi:hypothetical protein
MGDIYALTPVYASEARHPTCGHGQGTQGNATVPSALPLPPNVLQYRQTAYTLTFMVPSSNVAEQAKLAKPPTGSPRRAPTIGLYHQNSRS